MWNTEGFENTFEVCCVDADVVFKILFVFVFFGFSCRFKCYVIYEQSYRNWLNAFFCFVYKIYLYYNSSGADIEVGLSVQRSRRTL